ncbi:MAG TPA: ATPase [Enterovirga sp.]
MAQALGLNGVDSRQAREAARKAADQERGYRISYKRLALAFACEGVVVATSLAGAWLFATLYGGTDRVAFWMMMLAPVAYAVIEFSRVPLAVSIRTQRSITLRIIAAIGVIGAAAVTIKSVSQLGEIMFRPRLQEAVRTHETLIDAKNAQATLDRKIADADAVVAQRVSQLAEAEKRLKGANTELGALPPQRCYRVTTTNRDGRRTSGTRCSTDPRTEAMKTSLGTASTDRTGASTRLDEARAERAKFDRTEVDRKVSEAEVAHKDAIMRSQLHSFTAMVFGKDPGQVTDREIHVFLFFFVFIPAIGASLASTLLALTAVETLPREEEDVRLEDIAGNYILGPFAEKIVREAMAAAERSAEAALDRVRPSPTPEPAVASAAAGHAGPASPLRVVEAGR